LYDTLRPVRLTIIIYPGQTFLHGPAHHVIMSFEMLDWRVEKRRMVGTNLTMWQNLVGRYTDKYWSFWTNYDEFWIDCVHAAFSYCHPEYRRYSL